MNLQYERFEVLTGFLMILVFRDTTSCGLLLGAVVSEKFDASI
jgi:hypothetical protein